MNKPYSNRQNKNVLGTDDRGNLSKFQEVKYVPEEKTVLRKYEDISYHQNDLTQRVNRMAVWSTKHFEIFKISAIDYRGMRYELNGERMTRWIRFQDGELFEFCNEDGTYTDDFNSFYQAYINKKVAIGAKKYTSQEQTFSWLAQDSNRLAASIPVADEQENESEDAKRYAQLQKEAEEKLKQNIQKLYKNLE